MSQWGNLDRVVLTGTFDVTDGETSVVGDANVNLYAEAEEGYSLVIANVDYRINKITSANTLTLEIAYDGANVSGGTFAIQQDPKDLFTIGNGANTQNKRNVFGVDKYEVPANAGKGFNQPGWTRYVTYTDAHGQVRHKAEPLVAMSKNFNANATSVLQLDANDDATVLDYTLSFTTQPSSQSAAAGNAVTFVSVAASSPDGAVISYQWYEDGVALSDTGDYSGTDSNTLVVAEVANVNGSSFFVDIFNANAANVRSATVTATDTTA